MLGIQVFFPLIFLISTNNIRDQIASALQRADPWGVSLRCQNAQSRRGGYLVPGPNFIWSIDGHMKLSLFGIEIYGAIDVYSCYVP